MNRELDNELRTILRSHAESVQPTDHLGAIRARTQNGPAMQWWRRPLVLAGGAALVAASVVVGAVLLADPDPADPDPPMASSATREVTVFELGEVGARVWLYPVRFTTTRTDDEAVDAVRALTEHEPTGDRFSLWHDMCAPGADVRAVQIAGGVVTIDFATFAGETCNVEPQTSMATRQQLALTLLPATGKLLPVQLTVDGSPDGRPVSADPGALSPVVIDSPDNGTLVSSPVRVTGTSDTFEANVQWQVRRDGEVVDEGFTSGGTMGERGPFQFTVDLPPGTYTARAYATSAEDGRLVAEDTKTFTVR